MSVTVICKREEILKVGERTQLQLFQLLQFAKTLLMFMIHIHCHHTLSLTGPQSLCSPM